jgi:hypothetical protein
LEILVFGKVWIFAANFNMMKRLTIPCFLTLISFSGFGWGPTGHRTVGLIADKHLSAKAKKNITKILGTQSLAEVSTWMDEIRSDSAYNYTTDWHWVTIETGKTYDQSQKNPKGDVIATLEKIITELKKHILDKKNETEYLKMLVHLVGDIHMPLHVGCCDDQGGNKVKVKWFRAETNLHHVWDSDMIDDTKLSFTELAGFLGDLGYRYSYKYFSIARQRMLQAGIRLAGVLNQIYGK